MRIAMKYKAFPVHPHIQVEPAGIIQQLQAGFRIGGQVQFGIIQGFDKVMIRSPINISQYDIYMIRQCHLRTKKRKHMKAMLILVPLPGRDVLISQARIFCSSPVTQHMCTDLKLDIT